MKALIWILGITAIIYLTFVLLKPQIQNLLFSDQVSVQTYIEADKTELNIYFTAEEIKGDTIVLFKNAEQQESNLNYKGFNYFIVDYKGNRSVFEQFKTSKVSSHDYNFIIWEKGDSLQLDLSIAGPDASY